MMMMNMAAEMMTLSLWWLPFQRKMETMQSFTVLGLQIRLQPTPYSSKDSKCRLTSSKSFMVWSGHLEGWTLDDDM